TGEDAGRWTGGRDWMQGGTPWSPSRRRSPNTSGRDLVVLARRDPQGEDRALAHLALDPDPPAVELHKLPGGGKSHSRVLVPRLVCPSSGEVDSPCASTCRSW